MCTHSHALLLTNYISQGNGFKVMPLSLNDSSICSWLAYLTLWVQTVFVGFVVVVIKHLPQHSVHKNRNKYFDCLFNDLFICTLNATRKATRNQTYIHFDRVIIRNVNFGASSFRTVMAWHNVMWCVVIVPVLKLNLHITRRSWIFLCRRIAGTSSVAVLKSGCTR